MRLATLILSDIHFRANGPNLLDRAAAIVPAIRSRLADFRVWVIICPGDVAFSGQPAEYKLAADFFDLVVRNFNEDGYKLAAPVVCVPGNHDCDFSAEGKIRRLLREDSHSTGTIFDDETITHLTSVQNGYFDFVSSLEGSDTFSRQRFYSETRVQLASNGTMLIIRRLNSALLSTLHEQQGSLAIPLDRIRPLITPKSQPQDLAITLLHHPLSWFASMNSRRIRALLDMCSDVVITGHEHEAASYERRGLHGSSLRVMNIESPVFNDQSSCNSAFEVLTFNFDEGTCQRHSFSWMGSRYTCGASTSAEWPQNRAATSVGFQIGQHFEEWLSDPGATYSRAAGGNLQLNEIYVYQDCRVRTSAHFSLHGSAGEKHSSEDLIELSQKIPLIVITSPDRGGKTALAKMLYQRFLDAGLVPIYIKAAGRGLVTDLDSLIADSFAEQYSSDRVEEFRQLPPSKKVILVDDLHSSSIAAPEFVELFRSLSHRFGRTFCLFGDTLQVEEPTFLANVATGLDVELAHCQLMQLGYRQRGRLIEQWCQLQWGSNFAEQEVEAEVRRYEQQVNTVLGRNVLPALPGVVLLVLQALRTASQSTPAFGSFGHLYESLILSSVGERFLGTEFQKAMIIASRIAYGMQRRGCRSIPVLDVMEIIQDYQQRYAVSVNAERYLADLQAARILVNRRGNIEFKYNYLYYYFAALYFRDNLSSSESEDGARLLHELTGLVQNVWEQDCAETITFYVYFTKDRRVIDQILLNSKTMFAEHCPCDFRQDLEFVNELSSGGTVIYVSEPTDVRGNRDRVRQRRDELDSGDDGSPAEPGSDTNKHGPDLPPSQRFQMAFRTLFVLGQILRNFSGSLYADLKEDITAEASALSLRMLSWFLENLKTNEEEIRETLSKAIREWLQHKHAHGFSDSEIKLRSNQLLLYYVRGALFSTIKGLSNAIGHQDLRPTYKRAFADIPELSAKMIDVAIRLDHFTPFPENEVNAIFKASNSNNAVFNCLRELVATHIHLFYVERAVAQRMIKKLDLSISPVELSVSSSKRLPRVAQG